MVAPEVWSGEPPSPAGQGGTASGEIWCRLGSGAVAGESGLPTVEGHPANRLHPGRHSLTHRVSSVAGLVPPGMVGVDVSDDDGRVVAGEESRVEAVLSVVPCRHDGRSVDVEDVQVLRS